MEENKFKITLSDGTELAELTLNGNNYITKTKITVETFEGKLASVEITDAKTGVIQRMRDAILLRLEKVGKEYWFALGEKSAEEKEREELLAEIEAQAEAIQELAEIIGGAE
ncbi:MAG: hypothetical protein IJY32_03930 [Mogibacterium sp.]|nr:hypothetical protein [Mogibacterium sp.]